MVIHKYCIRCRKPMRNDGTEDNPVWACNNPKCKKYKLPVDSPEGGEDNTGIE